MGDSSAAKRIKVLHSIYCLGKGGIETWLMNLVRERSDEVQFDFAVAGMWGGYEEEAQDLGCRFHCETPPSRIVKRLRIAHLVPRSRFLETVLATHRYDVFHIHGDEFFGEALKTAVAAKVPVRVAHCHSTVLARGKKGPEMALRKLRFRTIDRWHTRRYATDIVACSSEAGGYFMGDHWLSDGRCQPLFCGVPPTQFREASNNWSRESFRRRHGIPDDAVVVGHVGSMGPGPAKNHFFLLDIFSELATRDSGYYLYLAGDGPLRPAIAEAVRARGLESRVAMPGLCSNVPALMVHGFDVHLLPSLQEGLPVVGLEAVAAGLFTVCSNNISHDFTGCFHDRVRTVSLDECPGIWADRVQAAVRLRVPAEEGVARIERSPFSITSSLAAVIDLYRRRLTEVERSTAAARSDKG